ncbi:RNA polymerase sigma factor [compost metagenome]
MREVFLLSRNTDLSHKEIGKQLGISDKTVKKQVVNAVRILRLKINLSIFLLNLF